MKALVLGATGHVGNAIARELLDRSWRVTAPSRRSERPSNLVGLDVDFRTTESATAEELERLVAGHDLVVDAAAPYHFRLAPSPDRETSSQGTARMRNLLSSVTAHGAILAYVSSFTTLPRQRSLLQSVRREILSRLHPYFELKRRMEDQVRAAAHTGTRAVLVNPTVALGPWDQKAPEHCLIPMVLQGRIPATTSHAVNVIDVRDIARALVNAVEREQFLGVPIPLWGHNTTMEGLIGAIARLGGRAGPRLRVSSNATAVAAYANEALSTFGLSAFDYPSLGPLLSLEQSWQSPSPAQRALGALPRPLSRTILEAVDWFRDLGHLDSPRAGAPPPRST